MDKIMTFLFSEAVAIENVTENLPQIFRLGQNYPNPFNPITAFEYQLPKQSDIKITIFNNVGSKIQGWYFLQQAPGTYKMTWDGTNMSGKKVSSWNYYYRLSTDDFSQTHKMVLLK